jgi:beta-aspartyl-dipeptidase (metallo-type)
MNHVIQCTLIRGGTLYTPKPEGTKDLLLIGDKIARIAPEIGPPGNFDLRVFDASGMSVVPGFIDLHVHLIGGGGEAGPTSRVPEITLSRLTTAGITTVIGVLGVDSVSRSLETLLLKVKALRQEGISAYMYTGSYHLPSLSITGSVKRDLALIDEILGAKVAISDHRTSLVTQEELARLAAEVRVGGMLSGKPGIVHVHVGDGSAGLSPLFQLVEKTPIPITQFLPTHTSRTITLLREGIEFVRQGGYIDLTAPSGAAGSKENFFTAVDEIAKSGIDMERVSLSSDGNGSMPSFDDQGQLIGMETGKVSSLCTTVSSLVASNTLPLPDALGLITTNPADRLGIGEGKGQLKEGMDADIVLLDEELRIEHVFARGRLMVQDGVAEVKGSFE